MLRERLHTAIDDVLVVDDDHAMVQVVVEALGEAGYLCCAAYDGESALMAIEAGRPALVLLDFHMPGLTGAAVVAELRRNDLGDVPVVLMTGDAQAASQPSLASLPDQLLKPFTIERLLGCVSRHLRPPSRA